MNELIAVFDGEINGSAAQMVNARELHEFLESKQQFSNWIKDRINHYGFTQDVDFIVINNFIADATAFGGQRKVIEYHITLEMAKELSMVERNEKGKKARQYFIECERAAISGITQFSNPAFHAIQVLMVEHEKLAREVADVKQNQNTVVRVVQDIGSRLTKSVVSTQNKLESHERILSHRDPSKIYNATYLGRQLNMTNRRVNQILEEIGFAKRIKDASGRNLGLEITPKGMSYGRQNQKLKTASGNECPASISWAESVIDVIRAHGDSA